MENKTNADPYPGTKSGPIWPKKKKLIRSQALILAQKVAQLAENRPNQGLLQLSGGPRPRKPWRPLKPVKSFGRAKLRLILITHAKRKTLKTEHIG